MTLDQFTTQASDYAVHVDRLFWLLSVISGLVVVVVTGLIVVFFALYYRGSPTPRGAVPERSSRELEIGWTVATLFTFLFLFWWAASDQLTALTPPKDALEIHVVAKQWMWRIQHPSGAREIDELHVPADTNVRLAMTSEDVIHDLYLPALRLKQDILPDRYTYLWFNATKTGIFHLTCAEFCGTDHSVMAGRLVIVTPSDYARWTAAQPEGDDLARQGGALFRSLGCSGCHTPGSTVHAPDLHGIYGQPVQLADGRTVTADEAYLRDCLLLPDKNRVAGFPPVMPNFTGTVSEGQIVALVAYLKSLSAPANDAAQGGAR
jgi:cytochrome c oxidase subunit II